MHPATGVVGGLALENTGSPARGSAGRHLLIGFLARGLGRWVGGRLGAWSAARWVVGALVHFVLVCARGPLGLRGRAVLGIRRSLAANHLLKSIFVHAHPPACFP